MKALFLDIDGVLQPYSARNRFEIDREKLQDDLTEKYTVDYHRYNSYDVAACYADWDKDAVLRIKKILDDTNSMIVISSDWRSKYVNYNPKDKMLDFLRIWGMNKYYYDETESYKGGIEPCEYRDDVNHIEFWKELEKEIQEAIGEKWGDEYHTARIDEIYLYLKEHSEVENYVVIDDKYMPEFKEHFVHTNNVINDEQVMKAIEVLNNDDFKIKRDENGVLFVKK